jgi:ABC-2 type transport system ATP-binding protein
MQTKGIILDSVTKTFISEGKPALNSVSAHLKAGKITGVVGPDGAGKTTLLRLMTGLLLPTKGTITVNDLDTQKNTVELHGVLGYMPQKFGLYEDLTVHENMTLYAELRGIPSDKRRSIFDRFLNFTNLTEFQGRLAGKLSGGMKQKLGLACALLKEPKVLLLDEPSVGVDPISRRELWKMVKEMIAHGTTVVWSTSYLDEAQNCDDVLVLNEGDLLYAGEPHLLTQQVQNRVFETTQPIVHKRLLLQQMLQDERVLDGLIKGDKVRLVVKKGVTPEDLAFPDIYWEAVPPVFEDGFIDLLGGIQERESILAKLISPIKISEAIIIKADHLTKKFGDFIAAQDVSFSIQQGEIFGFLGPNGAGKSTTFKMLCGLLTPTEGTSAVLGYNLREATSQAHYQIGYMAQKFSLYGNLSVRQNLSFFSGIYGLTGRLQKDAIDEMIDVFGLEPYLSESAEDLPLGYKQRLALACAIMHRPSVLFLDEPTSGVDPLTRREFWLHINGMVQKGVTIMVTTHFMDEAEYCDRICLIYRGRLIALGTPDDLKRQISKDQVTLPTLEETFINLIKRYDLNHEATS